MPAKKKTERKAHTDFDTGLKPVVTRQQMRVIIGISDRVFRDMIATGIVVLGDSPRDVLSHETLNNYHEHLRDKAMGKATSSGISLADARAEREIVEREIAQMKLATLKGQTMTSEEISASWMQFAVSVRSKFLGLPGKLRAQMSHLTAHDGEAMRRIIRSELEDLADEVSATVIGAEPKALKNGK